MEHQDGQSQLGQGSLDSGNGVHQLDDEGDLHASVVDQGIRGVRLHLAGRKRKFKISNISCL